MVWQVTWTCSCHRTHNMPILAFTRDEAIQQAVRACPCKSWRNERDDAIIEAFWNREFDIHNTVEIP